MKRNTFSEHCSSYSHLLQMLNIQFAANKLLHGKFYIVVTALWHNYGKTINKTNQNSNFTYLPPSSFWSVSRKYSEQTLEQCSSSRQSSWANAPWAGCKINTSLLLIFLQESMFVWTEATKGFQCKHESDRETRNNRASRIIIDNSSPASGGGIINRKFARQNLYHQIFTSICCLQTQSNWIQLMTKGERPWMEDGGHVRLKPHANILANILEVAGFFCQAKNTNNTIVQGFNVSVRLPAWMLLPTYY